MNEDIACEKIKIILIDYGHFSNLAAYCEPPVFTLLRSYFKTTGMECIILNPLLICASPNGVSDFINSVSTPFITGLYLDETNYELSLQLACNLSVPLFSLGPLSAPNQKGEIFAFEAGAEMEEIIRNISLFCNLPSANPSDLNVLPQYNTALPAPVQVSFYASGRELSPREAACSIVESAREGEKKLFILESGKLFKDHEFFDNFIKAFLEIKQNKIVDLHLASQIDTADLSFILKEYIRIARLGFLFFVIDQFCEASPFAKEHLERVALQDGPLFLYKPENESKLFSSCGELKELVIKGKCTPLSGNADRGKADDFSLKDAAMDFDRNVLMRHYELCSEFGILSEAALYIKTTAPQFDTYYNYFKRDAFKSFDEIAPQEIESWIPIRIPLVREYVNEELDCRLKGFFKEFILTSDENKYLWAYSSGRLTIGMIADKLRSDLFPEMAYAKLLKEVVLPFYSFYSQHYYLIFYR